jgi:hypothetical protein
VNKHLVQYLEVASSNPTLGDAVIAIFFKINAHSLGSLVDSNSGHLSEN